METRTNELQWVYRLVPSGIYPGSFLQQKWIITDENGVETEEWRDVPHLPMPPDMLPTKLTP